MIQNLVQYFILNDHLDLPGIGTLKWLKEEANWQNGQLIAPKEQIQMDPIDNKPSKHFYTFLADELAISSDQAALKFEKFISDFNNQTVADLAFGNLGVLHKKANQYQWISSFDASTFYTDILIDETQLSNPIPYLENNHIQKEFWWIWALLISVISVGLIYFKFN